MTGESQRVLDAARALQRHVAGRLAAERISLAALEQEARALQDLVSLMEHSSGRRR